MGRFNLLLPCGRRLVLQVVRSGAAHPSSSSAAAASSSSSLSYPEIWLAPASYRTYASAAASFHRRSCAWVFLPTTPAASSSWLISVRSHRAPTAAAIAGARSKVVPTPPHSASGTGWGFLSLAAVLPLGGSMGEGIFCTAGGDLEKEAISVDDEHADSADTSSTKAYPLDSFPELVYPTVFGLKGGSNCEYMKLGRVGYGLLKPEIYKELYRKARLAVGQFSVGSYQFKKSIVKHGRWVMMPLLLAAEFILYILEEGFTAIGLDILFGSIVYLVTGVAIWELKGDPFRERFIMEQPEDHMAHLTLKMIKEGIELLKEGAEAAQILKDSFNLKAEKTDSVIADHSSRILVLEKDMQQQSEVTKRIEDAVIRIEAAIAGGPKADEKAGGSLTAEKARGPEAPEKAGGSLAAEKAGGPEAAEKAGGPEAAEKAGGPAAEKAGGPEAL